MFQQLLWKQWHEQGWRIVFATVILSAFTGIGLSTRVVPDAAVLAVAGVIGVTLVPIFITMGLVAPSRGDGSFESLVALPIDPRKLFRLTVTTGVVGSCVPLLFATLAATSIAQGREIGFALTLGMALAAMVWGSLVSFWTLCLSVRLRHEAHVGLMGLIILVLLAGIAMALAGMSGGFIEKLGYWAWALHPATVLLECFGVGDGVPLAAMIVQIAVVLLLWRWSAPRFSR